MIGDIYIQTTEETRMIDTKKEQERDELHRAIWAQTLQCNQNPAV